jgi:hypothetical protein
VVGEVQRLIDQRVQIDHAPFARGCTQCASVARGIRSKIARR